MKNTFVAGILVLVSFLFCSFGENAHAVHVKEIEFVNDGRCFSRVQLHFGKEDERFFGHFKSDQEVCDDDGAFTSVLIFRAIQSFSKKYPQNVLLDTKMREWGRIQYSLLASLEILIKKTHDYGASRGGNGPYTQFSIELAKFKAKLETIGDNLPKFSRFTPLARTLERYLVNPNGGSSGRAEFQYTALPRYRRPVDLLQLGITNANFSLPESNQGRNVEPKYEGDFETIFQSFEAACETFLEGSEERQSSEHISETQESLKKLQPKIERLRKEIEELTPKCEFLKNSLKGFFSLNQNKISLSNELSNLENKLRLTIREYEPLKAEEKRLKEKLVSELMVKPYEAEGSSSQPSAYFPKESQFQQKLKTLKHGDALDEIQKRLESLKIRKKAKTEELHKLKASMAAVSWEQQQIKYLGEQSAAMDREISQLSAEQDELKDKAESITFQNSISTLRKSDAIEEIKSRLEMLQSKRSELQQNSRGITQAMSMADHRIVPYLQEEWLIVQKKGLRLNDEYKALTEQEHSLSQQVGKPATTEKDDTRESHNKLEVKTLVLRAKEGDIDAQRDLGMLYLRGGPGVSKSTSVAKIYLKLAAQQGDSRAQTELEKIEN